MLSPFLLVQHVPKPADHRQSKGGDNFLASSPHGHLGQPIAPTSRPCKSSTHKGPLLPVVMFGNPQTTLATSVVKVVPSSKTPHPVLPWCQILPHSHPTKRAPPFLTTHHNTFLVWSKMCLSHGVARLVRWGTWLSPPVACLAHVPLGPLDLWSSSAKASSSHGSMTSFATLLLLLLLLLLLRLCTPHKAILLFLTVSLLSCASVTTMHTLLSVVLLRINLLCFLIQLSHLSCF